jgi:hypothetical protein
MNSSNPHSVYTEFTRNVMYSHNYTKIDVLNLMSKYKITNADILMALYNKAEPFEIGIIENAYARKVNPDIDNLTMEQATKILAVRPYVDYLYGVPIKQNLDGKNTTLDIRRYDDRHFDNAFYQRFLVMLANKINNY